MNMYMFFPMSWPQLSKLLMMCSTQKMPIHCSTSARASVCEVYGSGAGAFSTSAMTNRFV